MKSFSLLLIFISSLGYAHEKKSLQLIGTKEKTVYETDQGKLNGPYTAYYQTGGIKSEGVFKDNNRTGRWRLYAEDGTLLVERNYQNSLQFEEVVPNHQTLQYNTQGFDTLKEKDIYCRKRCWQEITALSDPELFNQAGSFNQLLSLYSDHTIPRYEDERFVHPKAAIDFPTEAKVLRVRLKKDGIIDTHRYILDYRIIGLEVSVETTQGETSLGWIYYPDILAMPAKDAILRALKENSFAGEVYKSTLMPFPNPADDVSTVDKQQPREYMQIQLIEKEHDVWKQYVSNQKN